MAPDKSSMPERRLSTRLSEDASRLGMLADFHDDSYLDDAIVTDGFRPQEPSSQPPAPQTRPAGYSSENRPTQASVAASRLSIAKPTRLGDLPPTSLDGPQTRSHLSSVPSRVSSVSTDAPIIRAESPYQGPSGPSHPYQMYPQRTYSVITTSTEPVSERSYSGPRAAAHPYGLYTQNTTPDTSVSDETIPVGFLGGSDGYQRRMGPDGEESAGLIGPLGHTEELPPYTRYPESAHMRNITPTDGMPAGQPVAGAGGIGLATRNPEYESSDELDPAPSASGRRTSASMLSHHELNTAARGMSEKPYHRPWKRRARRRVWGQVPCWVVCLVAIGLVVLGIVLGAVMGTFFAKQRRPPSGKAGDSEPQTSSSATPTGHAVALPSFPPGLAALDVGTFSLPPLVASLAPSGCVNDTAQSQAWTCFIPFTMYSMTVERVANRPPYADHTVRVTPASGSNQPPPRRYSWGTQPPFIADPIPMSLVTDLLDTNRGPAWFAEMSYDKTVIVPEDRFPAVLGLSTPSRRIPSTKRNPGFGRKAAMGAQAGDRPWICTWPGTILEVFIYPSQVNSLARSGSTSSSTSSGPPTPASTSADSDFPSPNTNTPGPYPTDLPRNKPPPYPKTVKIEEHRLSGLSGNTAKCRQVQLIDDNENSIPVLDNDGDPVEVVIVEKYEAPPQFPKFKRWIPEHLIPSRDVSTPSLVTQCGCTWLLE